MNDPPSITPPAHVRTMTLEQLTREILELKAREAEDYSLLRDLSSKIDKNHIVMMDNFGELARMLGKVGAK